MRTVRWPVVVLACVASAAATWLAGRATPAGARDRDGPVLFRPDEHHDASALDADAVRFRHRQPVLNTLMRGLLGRIHHAEAPERNAFASKGG